MDHYRKLQKQVSRYIFGVLVLGGVLASGIILSGLMFYDVYPELVLGSTVLAILVYSYLFTRLSVRYILQPLDSVRRAILHVSPTSNDTTAPDLKKVHLGRELVTSLVLQVYQYASQTKDTDENLEEHRTKIVQAANIVSHLPLPLFVLNKDQLVTSSSDAALSYCGLESSQLFGKPLYDNVFLEFPSDRTLDAWIKSAQENKVTDTTYWERVRMRIPDQPLKQFDMAAYYNRDNPSGTEFIITLFDRTEQYAGDDQSLSFVALAVHELRTPLTMLRGYIEVFEEEFHDSMDEELKGFMVKMKSSAKQLSAFVNNILNVARIDENQLTLQLSEQKWGELLQGACSDAEIRSHALGKTLVYEIENNLPSVAVDPISIYEVLNNLLDNAMKYSGASKEIIVSAKVNQDGLVETSIQDFGVGIPSSVLPHLFEKFSRNHRTRMQIGGTGLGLYLSKAIIGAHGGNIWVSSKEGKGSTFSFTLLPYSQLADELKNSNNKDIVRNAHGWIKNHSLYRR
jgi:two-component system, OmpR family, sensor histidine kinase VicK